MSKGRNLGMIALIAGAGAVGVLATLFAVVATRGPAATPESVDARQQAVQELTEQLTEVTQRMTEMSERVEVEQITVTGTARAARKGATVRIRSSGSFVPGGEPTIYIDGVRVDGNREEALQRLSPDQIDRVEVLKGDAAKERYGSEAANGVIEIVTKSKEGS
ncbi:MAG: TonB-dependent receptor plug domain-containing protein [Gemmatimonadetes bacterium]|nr:TonB-dependent receptor plug domain-containing protein [Gemmatimonadota bacterium]